MELEKRMQMERGCSLTCSEHELAITNTLFQLKEKHKTSWKHPRSNRWHLLDYIIVRQADRKEVQVTRAMRGATCWTDHNLIRSKVNIELRPKQRKQAPSRKLNIKALDADTNIQKLRQELATNLSELPHSDSVEESCQNLLSTVSKVAADTLGFSKRRNQDWFDENSPDIQTLLKEKYSLHNSLLENPHSHRLKNRYKSIKAEIQRRLRLMENEWWLKKAQEIQGYADTNNIHCFYNATKTIYGPRKYNITPVRSADGSVLYKEKDQIVTRWAEHFDNLLNHVNSSNPTILDTLPNLPQIQILDNPPAFSEVLGAIKGLKNNKSPGPDGIPGEIFKKGGYILKQQLHQLLLQIWEDGNVPQILKDGNIITLYKKKGDKSICGNSRGITLLSVAGKVLTRILLFRIIEHLTESTLPETQCGFRKERSVTDMIFTVKQLQEKSREHRQDFFMAFIDLSKAFDTVNRSILWKLLEKCGIPPKFLKILEEFHNGMQARVQIGGMQSDPFNVNVGVKQGCVLAPILFNIFLMAVTQLVHASLGVEAGVDIAYRLDGNLFNLRRLQARTKVAQINICELQYADDCAVIAQDPQTLQRMLDIFSSIYSALGLKINTAKTEVIAQYYQPPIEQPHFTIDGTTIKVVEHFTYLGSILNQNCSLDSEIQARIHSASSAFGRLRERVFCNKNIKIATKAAVYRAVCISTLLYASETWTPYRRHIRALERFHIDCLNRILGSTWKDKFTRNNVFQRTNLCSIEALLAQRHLRWLGHTIRMPEHRLPRQVLYGQLAEGTRAAGGQRKRYKDHCKETLKKCNIPPESLETMARDRNLWRRSTLQGMQLVKSSLSLRRA